MRKVSYILVFILLCSCNNKEINTKIEKTNKEYKVNAVGEIKNDSYIFCSIGPIEVEYSYRIGTWRFLNKENIKIAEGEYDTIIHLVDSIGGCEYTYTVNDVNLKKWDFWNDEGEQIEPTKKLIDLISSELYTQKKQIGNWQKKL